jgi:hypothetical protein
MDFDARLELTSAVRERDTLRRRHEEVMGIDAFVDMHAAEVRVTALERYLAWSEDTPPGAEPHPTNEEMEPYALEVAWFDPALLA